MNLKNKVILAPMAGVTDQPMRRMVRRFGNQLLFTEMMPAEILRSNPRIIPQIKEIADEKNIGVQIMGHKIPDMVTAAKLAEGAGAVVIDINMGCPVRKIVAAKAGCYLMREPEHAAEIVRAVRAAVSVPVTVKMRAGIDEAHAGAADFALAMAAAGACGITVHGRTQKQMYGGKSNPLWIRQVKEAVQIPVIANGDVADHESALDIIAETGADGVMIGRGILGRPWALSMIETGKLPKYNLKDLMLEHYDLMLSYYGRHGVFVARKHLAWYAAGHPDGKEFIRKMNVQKDSEDVVKLIKEYIL